MEEVDLTSFFVKEPGLTLALKMCPNHSQAFEEVNNSQAFTVGKTKITLFFSDEPLPGAPRHACTKFRASIRGTDCVRTNIKSYLTPKIEYTLKPSNYDAKP